MKATRRQFLREAGLAAGAGVAALHGGTLWAGPGTGEETTGGGLLEKPHPFGGRMCLLGSAPDHASSCPGVTVLLELKSPDALGTYYGSPFVAQLPQPTASGNALQYTCDGVRHTIEGLLPEAYAERKADLSRAVRADADTTLRLASDVCARLRNVTRARVTA